MNSTTGSSFENIDAFVDHITAPTRAAEAAVQLDRTDDVDVTRHVGWTITHDGVTITLTNFEARRLVARIGAVQNIELRAGMGRTTTEDDPEILALVRS